LRFRNACEIDAAIKVDDDSVTLAEFSDAVRNGVRAGAALFAEFSPRSRREAMTIVPNATLHCRSSAAPGVVATGWLALCAA